MTETLVRIKLIPPNADRGTQANAFVSKLVFTAGRLSAKYILDNSGDWIHVRDGEPYPELYLPVLILDDDGEGAAECVRRTVESLKSKSRAEQVTA